MARVCQRCSHHNEDHAKFCLSCGAMLEVDASADEGDPLIGKVLLGRYRPISVLGEGGMGKVYLSEQKMGTATRKVAIKTLHPELGNDPQLVARFHRESETVIELRHPNTIQFYDFGELEDGTLIIVMEYIEGKPLANVLEDEGAIDPKRADKIIIQICGSLHEAHQRGVVHRDLKPENVFLVEDADGMYPKLLDFGVSRAVDPRGELKSVLPTVENAIVGTPQYMSPEQARGLRDLDHRSDIWAVGVMLYELLTGQLPFDADAVGDIIIQIATADPPAFSALRPDLAGPIEHVVQRAMARKKEDRYESAREMRAALLGAVARTASQMQGATSRLSRPQVLSDSDLAPIAAKELLDAVGAAYEEGDSGLIDFSGHIDALEPAVRQVSPKPPPPPPRNSRPDPFLTPSADETGEMPQVDALPVRKKPVALLVAGAVVALAAIGGLGVWAVAGQGDPVAEPVTETQPSDEVAPEPETREAVEAPEPAPITLALTDLPDGAEVRLDGVPQEGAGPWELPRDDAEHRVEVRTEDGRSWEQTHVASEDATYAVALPEPAPPPTKARHPRRPRRPGATRPGRGGGSGGGASGGNLMRDPGF